MKLCSKLFRTLIGVMIGLVASGALAQDSGVSVPNIILISIDTLRADHLGCYGYERDTSPNVDAFAAQALRYVNAFAPAPWTLPSHACMLTGVHPYFLGIDHERSAIPDDAPYVAQFLVESGYQTAAFVDSAPSGFVGAERGFDRGFETFEHAPFASDLLYAYDFAATVDAAKAWLEQRDVDRPLFLFLHTKSVHAVPGVTRGESIGFPYEKPRPYLERFHDPETLGLQWWPRYAEYLRDVNQQLATGAIVREDYPDDRRASLIAQYDGGIAYMDEHFGRLIGMLRDSGLYDSSLIVLTADHGEAFLEHRFFLHNEVYDHLIRVPLLVKLPGAVSAQTIKSQVSLEDIAPTILRAAGAAVPAAVTGRVLLSADSGTDERSLLAYYRFGSPYFKDEFALRQGPWKFVMHRYGGPDWGEELYNTDEDPDEMSPVTDPDRSRAMRRVLDGILSGEAARTGSEIGLDEETIEHLKSLGYLE